MEEWTKKQEKRKKKGEPYDSVMAPKPLDVKIGVASQLDPDKNISFSFPTPLAHADTAGSALLTNTRHIELVRQSRQALQRALDSIEAGMPVDCAVVDLREAWELLGSITGDTVHDDMVEEIFSRFCLGK